jgi:hypothetical protein
MAIGIITKLLIGALVYEGAISVKEEIERHSAYNQAREYSDATGKPLLVVGMKRFPWQPDNGDITVDLDPKVEELEGGICADICDLPFPDKYFGAVYCPHVLEHLRTAEDVQQAVNECTRVADEAYFLCPSPYKISNLFLPSHHQRVWFDQALNQIRVKHWNPPFPLGNHTNGQYEDNRIAQVFVARGQAQVVKWT